MCNIRHASFTDTQTVPHIGSEQKLTEKYLGTVVQLNFTEWICLRFVAI